MLNFHNRSNIARSNNYPSFGDSNSFNKRFNIFFIVAVVMFVVIFLTTIVVLILAFTGHLPFHYSVTQTWGNTSYHQEYGTN